MFNTLPTSILVIAAMTSLQSCGSVEETEKVTPPPVVEIQKPPDPPVSFSTTTDTIATTSSVRPPESPAVQHNPEIRFMVQIGAFKDAENASRIQALARERYRQPVFNDYNTAISLYQIRLGFFETREAAKEFRDRMVKEYPEDYKDAWVAQLTQ